MTEKMNLTNHFLIAMPQLSGSYFGNTVVYMWQHDDDGALGVVVNLPLQLKLKEIFSQLDIEVQRPESGEAIVLSGGPVETDKGFILHDTDGHWQSTLRITDNLFITTSKDILDDISRGEGPNNYLVALGCSGWSRGQLEQEIANNSWITCPATKDIIFSRNYSGKPDMAAATLGFSMVQLTTDVGRS
jgi:putative transcriptional regulator